MSTWSELVDQATKQPKNYTYMRYETFMNKLKKEMARASEIYLALCIATAVFTLYCLGVFFAFFR